MMETVGFIGLGNMGGGMANNIQKAGYQMVVYDIREEATRPFLEAGARLGSSPADVASRTELVLTSLPGPREVEAVEVGPEGVLHGISAGVRVYRPLHQSTDPHPGAGASLPGQGSPCFGCSSQRRQVGSREP